MSKEAVFLSPSSFSRALLHPRGACVTCSTGAWMRSVCGTEASRYSATRSLDNNHFKISKDGSFGSVLVLSFEKCPLPKHEHPRTFFCVSQLSELSLGQSIAGKNFMNRMVRVEVAGLDYHSFSDPEQAAHTTEGPSCIYVGPLEKAEKARLEALYQQARDSYYSGRPLIVDDMFDRVETMLRWHGSKVVMKYPRCSLKRYSAYSDAEIDSSQMRALASIWAILLASGIVAAAGPPACAITKACQKSVRLRFESHGVSAASEAVMYMNGLLAISMGLAIGIPVALAAARSLQGLWRGDLVAMKGCCPSCGEEVYAFVRADQSGQPQHKTDCHVCEHPLMFRANVERSSSHPGHLWAYGRVYLSTQSKDLVPNSNKL